MIALRDSYDLPGSHFRQMIGFARRSTGPYLNLGLASTWRPLQSVRAIVSAVDADVLGLGYPRIAELMAGCGEASLYFSPIVLGYAMAAKRSDFSRSSPRRENPVPSHRIGSVHGETEPRSINRGAMGELLPSLAVVRSRCVRRARTQRVT